MINIRNVLIAIGSAIVAGGLVSCGGGGGGGGTPTPYSVGGTVSGLLDPVVLQLNGAGNHTITALGGFTFPGSLANGSTYNVTVLTQAAGQSCSIANGTGTLSGGNVTNVSVTCVVNAVIRSGSLTGAQENPPVTTAATGRGAVLVDPATLEIIGGMTFTGVTPTAGGHHIHQAPSGNPTANGPVIIGLILAPDNVTATVPAGTTLTAAQYTALLAGELYFNVHSAANPSGEIRGQINVQGGVIAGVAALDGTEEVPANASTATGLGTIMFDSATRAILICYVTHDVVGTNVAHIHTGAPGVSGPANVVTLTQGTNIYTAPSPTTLTAQQVTDLTAGNTYFNVHSLPNFAAGEIRGQIAVQ